MKIRGGGIQNLSKCTITENRDLKKEKLPLTIMPLNIFRNEESEHFIMMYLMFQYFIKKTFVKKNSLDVDKLKNYRPVSTLHFTSKILETGSETRLDQHFEANSLVDNMQSSYRAGLSSETALLNPRCYDIVDNKCCAILVMLNLSTAFYTIDYPIMINRLEYPYYITDSALFWMKFYLVSQTPRVAISSILSEV